ncbi:MAG: GDP-mannose 4,6-dehydratase [Nostocoides sp.]
MPNSGKVALVTGVTGQDGSYLAERLTADGWQVHGLIQPHPADAPAALPNGVQPHPGDLEDASLLVSLVADLAPDHIYHLGGLTSVAQSWADPVLTTRVTGLSSVALLHAAQHLHDRGYPVRFIQATSAEIFGEPTVAPQTEATPVAPITPYGVAKALAHQAVAVSRLQGLHASSLILYNHESPRRGPQFVTRKITQGAALVAKGELNQLRLGNLDARRDWGWAPDYVDAMVRAAGHERADDYIVATGVSHSVRDFVTAAFSAAGIEDWERHVVVDPAFFRPADAGELRGDPTRIETTLGWRRTRSFAQIVAAMVNADLDPPPNR